MITNRPLTPEEQKRSCLFYNLFNLVNGFAYICLGENIIILFALRIQQPNVVISALGGMVYLGYLLLPIGKIFTSHVGAIYCQQFFWVIRNLSAFLVAGSSIVYTYVSQPLAMFLLLAGAFVFYGARAAGVAVIQPLFGEITNPHTRSAFLARNSFIGYFSSFLTLAGIASLLYFTGSGLRMLEGIIVTGGVAGILSTRFLARMSESGRLRDEARKPSGEDMKFLLADPIFLRLLAANGLCNLAIILLVPISLLAVKRGYGVSDTAALGFSVFQLSAAALSVFFANKPVRAIGPRRFSCIVFLLSLCIALLWRYAPAERFFPHLALVFYLGGSMMSCLNLSFTMYLLQMVEENKRVMASLLIALISGAGAGVAGILISGGLLHFLAGYVPPGAPPLALYRLYFTAAGLLLLPGVFLIGAMTPVPIEKRRAWKLPVFPFHF